MVMSTNDDGTKHHSGVVKMGANENEVVTFTVMSLFPFS